MSPRRGMLFSAFEPSGDELAAPVIRRLRDTHPDLRLWALGGPRMQQAGAEMIEMTAQHAAMLGDDLLPHLRRHVARLGQLKSFVARHDIVAHVPIDSPVLNWSICQMIRDRRPGARIAHLSAPQLWLWGSSRIGKLRRLTDHVLCLLPFEPAWFTRQGVRATFVGHPLAPHTLTSEHHNLDQNDAEPMIQVNETGRANVNMGASGESLTLGLLPGSREHEIRMNWPTMARTANMLRRRFADLCVTVAAADERAAQSIDALSQKRRCDSQPFRVRVGQTGQTLRDCDVALIAAGTATLQAAMLRTPMVAMYNLNWFRANLLIRPMTTSNTYALPNMIAEAAGRPWVVPEFVPHSGDPRPLVEALTLLLAGTHRRAAQREALRAITEPYEHVRFADAATQCVLQLAGYTTQ